MMLSALRAASERRALFIYERYVDDAERARDDADARCYYAMKERLLAITSDVERQEESAMPMFTLRRR